MKHIHSLTSFLFYIEPDRKGVAQTAPKAQQVGAAAMPAKNEDPYPLLPFTLEGFKMNVGKAYVQKSGESNQKLCDVMLKFKGSDWYIIGNVTRVTPAAANVKPSFRLALPASPKAGGNYFEAVIKSDSAAAKAMLEAWKLETLSGPFMAWAKANDLKSVIAGVPAASSGLVALDLDL